VRGEKRLVEYGCAALIGGARLPNDLKDCASSLACRHQNMSHAQTRAEPWPTGSHGSARLSDQHAYYRRNTNIPCSRCKVFREPRPTKHRTGAVEGACIDASPSDWCENTTSHFSPITSHLSRPKSHCGIACAGTPPVSATRCPRARMPRQYFRGNRPIPMMMSWLATKASSGPNA